MAVLHLVLHLFRCPHWSYNTSLHSEGIVIGSILVQSEESKDDEDENEAGEASFLSSKWWSQLFQQKAKDYNYYMTIWRLSVPKYVYNRRFASKYVVTSKHGSEKIFIAKLEEGEYHFAYMAVADDRVVYYSEDIDVRFLVTPGGTTYIGRLVVNVPAILWPSDITIEVQDAQGSTIEESREKYADQVKEVSKKLMRPEKSVVLLDYGENKDFLSIMGGFAGAAASGAAAGAAGGAAVPY